jgi:hypothetical protein
MARAIMKTYGVTDRRVWVAEFVLRSARAQSEI